jgi:hypothetical protein
VIPFSYLAFVQVNAAGTIIDEWSLTDGTRYALEEYAPVVAPIRRSRMGGSGDYGEVSEVLTLHVIGGTATQAVANLESLIGALDQAAAWARDETASVIQLRAQVLGGTVGELASVVLGAEPDESPADVAPTQDGACWYIRGVTLRFRRRGLWLAPTADAATGATVNIGEISTASVAAHYTLSPCRVIVERIDASNGGYGFFLGAARASQLQIWNVAVMTNTGTAGAAVSTAESAGNYSRSGNILRFTAASGATSMRCVSGVAITIPNTDAVVHVFCNVRPASATPAWDLQIRHYDTFGFPSVYQEGPRVAVPQVAAVSMLYLGRVARVESWGALELIARVSAASYPQTLDLDTIVLLADDPTAMIIGVFAGEKVRLGSGEWVVSVDPRALSAITPAVTQRSSGDVLTFPFQAIGDGWPQQQGAAMSSLLYIDGLTGPRWRATNLAQTLPATVRTLVRRAKGYRVPQ